MEYEKFKNLYHRFFTITHHIGAHRKEIKKIDGLEEHLINLEDIMKELGSEVRKDAKITEEDTERSYKHTIWIDPKGTIIPCATREHLVSADALIAFYYDLKSKSPDEVLLTKGWIKLHGNDIWHHHEPNKRQQNAILKFLHIHNFMECKVNGKHYDFYEESVR